MRDEAVAMKAIQRAIWTAGDYDVIAGHLWDAGKVVVDAAAIEPQMDVLDIGTGTGNAALRAAQAGAHVVGLDLTPELFDAARRRAEALRVNVDWVEGDAEELPFGDESFDRVLSTFGVMFAPRHELAASELVRVCRSGGQILLASWAPGGFFGRLIQTITHYMPPPSAAAQPPILWGDESHVRALLGGQILLGIERHDIEFVFATLDDMLAAYQEHFGPLVLARKLLRPQERYDDLIADVRALLEHCDAGEGELRILAEYLLVVGLKP
ncbi:MAG TPA: class I SAM-dependent methyltransferase [Solirubrobacteraceae bacterium]